MVFSSYVFLFLFLPLVLLVYYGLPGRERGRMAVRTFWLTIASYVFYGWAGADLCLLMLLSTVVDLLCSWGIVRSTWLAMRRGLLTVSVVVNVGLLAVFKYTDLGMRVLRGWPEASEATDVAAGELLLPVGISFYTFQSMSYTIDVYRGRVQPVAVARTLDFVCYVALFPQLVAGPIVRFRHMRQQFLERRHGVDGFAEGCFRFALGLGKKVLVADQLTTLAGWAYGASEPGLLDSWCCALTVAIRFYFDFSAYSDMAVGLGKMFGFDLPENFASPYKAESMTAAWRRWHMTLTAWLRDYLYGALGGGRRGRARTYFNLATTMMVCGVWHGSGLTFVVWGGYNGLLLIVERMLGPQPYSRLPRLVRVAVTFTLWSIGAVIFGAGDLGQMSNVLAGMAGWHGIGEFSSCLPRSATLSLLVLAAGTVLVFTTPTARELARKLTWPRVGWAIACLLSAIAVMLCRGFQPFVYFRF